MRSWRKLGFAVLLAALAGGFAVVRLNSPYKGFEGQTFIDIPRGSSSTAIARTLVSAGVVSSRWDFLLARIAERGRVLKAGEYRFARAASPIEVYSRIARGDIFYYELHVPEGRNMFDIAASVEKLGLFSADSFLEAAQNPSLIRDLDRRAPTLEGYLFPDTYKLRPHSQASRVLTAMVRRHRQVFEELRAANPTVANYLRTKLKFDDAAIVTLASIVEKETGRPEERPRIAQVFINRLVKPSFRPRLLQTNPTIVYGCTVAPLFLGTKSPACEKWDGRIHRIHLDDTDNPYNTYTHEGLPPGPIANPGRAALAAVFRPDGSNYLYFVAKNDGTHHFSATIAEHEAAVVKYQRGGKALP